MPVEKNVPPTDLKDAELEDLIRRKHHHAMERALESRPASPRPVPDEESYRRFLRVKDGIDDTVLAAAGLPPAGAMTFEDFSGKLGGARSAAEHAGAAPANGRRTPSLAIDPGDRIQPYVPEQRRSHLWPVVTLGLIGIAVLTWLFVIPRLTTEEAALSPQPPAVAATATPAQSEAVAPTVPMETRALVKDPLEVPPSAPKKDVAKSEPAIVKPVEKPVEKPAEKPVEKPASKKSAPTKPDVAKPAQPDATQVKAAKANAAKTKQAESDEGWSALLKSLTTSDAQPEPTQAPPMPESTVPESTVPGSALPGSVTQGKEKGALPATTSPATPGTTIFTPQPLAD